MTPTPEMLARQFASEIAEKEFPIDECGKTVHVAACDGALAAIAAVTERAAAQVETMRIGGGTLSSWINTNESPMDAARRHIATALRNFDHLKGATPNG